MGTITQTGDNGNTDNSNTDNSNTDNGNTDNGNTDNGNTDNGNSSADVQPNGTPDGKGGVWENGVVYAPGDMYYGHVVQDIIYYPGGYSIATAW